MALCPARSRSIKKGFALKVLSKMKLFRPSVMAVCLVIALPVVAGAWLVEEWKSQVVGRTGNQRFAAVGCHCAV